MNVNFVTVCLWLACYSFLGWLYESTLCSITGHKLVNRGFLNGPVCPIYGFGALTIIFCLQSSADGSLLVLFLSGAVLTSILEYVTSWAMEKLFQTRWWDYSKYRFQINGRVCLLGAVAFGAMSVLLLKVVHPVVAGLVARIPAVWQMVIFAVLLVLVTADAVATIRSILSLNDKLREIQEAINKEKQKTEQRLEQLKTSLEEHNKEWLSKRFEGGEFYSERINHLLSQRKYMERRLLKAFPQMQSVKNSDALSSLKSKLKKGIAVRIERVKH
ncbi:MAG: hypothetical protein RR022_05735 [Angelakisella sp.]